ncbi:MAG: hypothetical protein FJ135_05715, partial [Deltaproteobacteria bacterium]|nr:hypothetical protein [Deltaproteobacteria bacterium]
MSTKEVVFAAFKEMVLPELAVMKQEQAEIKATLMLTNKRLDDITSHLIDQSRRIDEANKRIDFLREELIEKIDAVREELGGRIDAVREELGGRIDAVREEMG